MKKRIRETIEEVKNENKNAIKETKVNSSDKGTKDEELKETIQNAGSGIKVIGTGGSGNNTMKRMQEIGIKGAELVAMNTDAQHLLSTPANSKLLLGKKITDGLGAGSDPKIGEKAAKEQKEEIKEQVEGLGLVFVTCGLGGGTGTGTAPVIARQAKELGALSVAVVTLPFSVEGEKRMDNAIKGLKRLRESADTVIVIPNDKLLEIVPELPLNAAFKVADEVLANAVKGITEMITKPGLVNLDFADIRTILKDGGAAMIGLGESDTDETGEARALEAVEEALNSPLLDVDVSNAGKALINVVGGPSMSLREAEVVMEAVASKIKRDSHIIWGAMIDKDMRENKIETMVVIAGGKIPFIDLEKGEEKLGPDIHLDMIGEE
ncbi:MAG: cell division protein FtsZ [archaeon]